MAPKRRKQTSSSDEKVFAVIRDRKTSKSQVIPVDRLSYSKKDNLKIGTSVAFKGTDGASRRCQGIVVAKGTKQQCDQSLSIIEKSNSVDTKDSSDSDNLQIDERAVVSDSDGENVDHSDDDNETAMPLSISKESSSVISKDKNPTISSATSTSNSASITLPADIEPSTDVALRDISNDTNVNSKRKELTKESTPINNKKQKRSAVISHSDFERALRENAQLKKELTMYKDNWMPRPKGAAMTYFIDVGKVLAGAFDNQDDEDKGEKLENICAALGMNEKELKSCEHETDITKTCRQIIKFIYRDSKERARTLVSTMNTNILHSIQEYAKMAHPALSKINNSVLNNAIGNVFATDKRRFERDGIQIFMGNDVNDVDEDDENF
ncbi:unnamed protein product [Adineta ricciae]|uniref:Uncharacterized protein n=1 Tax=Adineta ricciae TaxID=249248 RepID=A0A815QVI4_ADIRI|nr:unnamed protein product [Adineta ricciae]CAF1467485.1 unnamed protein product [Adineta ricciae]